jgi:antitoxin CcdA
MADVNDAKRKAINVTVDVALAREAREAGVNISGVLDRALRAEMKSVREAKWRDENRAAIEAMNQYVEEHGLPLDKYRVW